MGNINILETHKTRSRYERLSSIYDFIETLAEHKYSHWRKSLWEKVQGDNILEVGVGTGRNIPFYPDKLAVTAIDLTPGMLKHAQARAAKLDKPIDLHLGDVQELIFPSNYFDTAVATFVFCSVPDPVLGLRELSRVVKPGGQVLLLEHMRSSKKILGYLMDVFNPIVVRLMGANINRRTLDNVQSAGLLLEDVEDLDGNGIFKLIQARVSSAGE